MAALARGYRLVGWVVLVAAVLAYFLGFFFVFVLAPVVPLGLFYVGYLVARERRLRRERRRARLLEHEAEARRRLLESEHGGVA